MSLFSRRARAAAAVPAGPRTVTLIGRPGCHLCDVAREVVERVTVDLDVEIVERDITTDEELHRRYWDKVPVVLVDGAPHAVYRVNPDLLRRALT
ncbi:glutaredoxin family protein [Allostreptomyces psammosilenae]|uniref:Glutaredoxin n=1 Tax=Allostreptomyces psammosilenae TaxID=1892865 RepID=A0A852ZWY1_9ACTN|nr:glutaredoxin family protein [Allostreptomyces psammosilenae]NYI05760.1 glutaredoxin [Allostreptomyces psammosilenae]